MGFFACYDYQEEWLLVEMAADVTPSRIPWHKFQVPAEGIGPDNWQAPYQEQYLNSDGTERICDLYDLPEEDTAPSRFVFFLYRDGSEKLVCPYGEYSLTDPQPLPQRLADIVEFESDEDEDEFDV